MKLLNAGFAMALTTCLAACAHQSWVAGPNAQGTFSEAKGRCMLLANNTGGGFYAQGSQTFVASAAAGAAIGNAIKAASNFDACMMANGWEIADDAPKAASYAPTAPYAAPGYGYPAASAPVRPSYTGDSNSTPKNGEVQKNQPTESVQPVSVATAVASPKSDADGAEPVKSNQANNAASAVGPTKPIRPKVKPAQPRPLSSIAAALTAAPSKQATSKSLSPIAVSSSAGSSSAPAPCTHEQQVEARIAKMNGYTGGPKCD